VSSGASSECAYMIMTERPKHLDAMEINTIGNTTA
jgi:hypothetical protein